mmetsp:Transcript_17612/g.44708  ORF Transcript_17612/g.44708 Transcript_17612/m.44708 type:complete len:210 (-) Transcript_17612:80-709(-)
MTVCAGPASALRVCAYAATPHTELVRDLVRSCGRPRLLRPPIPLVRLPSPPVTVPVAVGLDQHFQLLQVLIAPPAGHLPQGRLWRDGAGPRQRRQVLEREVHVLGGVQQKGAAYDRHKPAELRRDLRPALHVLEQYERGQNRRNREHHVVDGADDGGVEDVQSLVQVVHLRHDAEDDNHEAVVDLWVDELVVSFDGELDGNAQCLAAHD